MVGNVPQKISAMCSLFLRQKVLFIAGLQQVLSQGGLEVPSRLIFHGEPQNVAKTMLAQFM